MNSQPESYKRSPAKSISELERSHHGNPKSKYSQFGLGRLIVATNLLGISMAVIVLTRGGAIVIAISFGILVGFLLPGLVMAYITVVELRERIFGRPEIPLASQSRRLSEPRSPFDDDPTESHRE